MFKELAWFSIILSISYLCDGEDLEFRLPRNIIPNKYRIDIYTDIYNNEKSFKYFGLVNINVTCKTSTNEITLHSKNLKILEDEIKVIDISSNGLENEIAITFDDLKRNDFIKLRSNNQFEAEHNYSITLKFEGNLTTNLVGYYLTSSKDLVTNETMYSTITHFEPTDARRAFPCFDEPDLKAKFQINLGYKKGWIPLSNMHLINTSMGLNDTEWSHFEESVVMSTYLVAFGISKFQKRSSVSKSGIDVNIWATPSAYLQTEFASEFAPKVLDFFEEFFNISYPMKKVDLIAIPDFSSGAMENWGLITFRESALLTETNTTPIIKYGTASIIAHELAHQWFGNLVTMKWWSDLWLNEGFATFMANLAVQEIMPEWNTFNYGVLTNILAILNADSLNSSHPIQVPIGDPSEINEIFDAISYNKGSFMLRQLRTFLGPEVFRKGVQLYLQTHKFQNAEQEDLWSALNLIAIQQNFTSANITVDNFISPWTHLVGFPVITVTSVSGNQLHLRQDKYSHDLDDNVNSDNSTWLIPLTYTLQNGESNQDRTWKALLNGSKIEPVNYRITINESNWYTLNNEFESLVLINYDENNWKLLNKTLSSNHMSIPVMTRVNLIISALSLADVNLLTYDVALDVVKYIKNEESYLPMKAALIYLGDVEDKLEGRDISKNFKTYMVDILTPLYKKYGGLDKTKITNNFEQMQRWLLITSQGCYYEIADCKTIASQIFKNKSLLEDIENNEELKSLVYKYAVKSGDQSIWDRLYRKMIQTSSANERIILLVALSQSPNTTTLKKYISKIKVNSSEIRSQDFRTIFNGILNTKNGYNVSRDFFYRNIAELHDIFKSTPSSFANILKLVAKRTYVEGEINTLNQFIDENAKKYFENISYGLRVARESLQINLKWSKKNLKRLRKYFM